MAFILQVEIANPKDVTASFNKIRVYRSTTTDVTGSFSLLATIDINATSDTQSTLFLDTAGSDTFFYRATYFNSTSLLETDLASAPTLKGDSSFLLDYIGELLNDSAHAEFSVSILRIFRDEAVNKLYNKLGQKFVKTITGSATLYDFPLDFNTISIHRVGLKPPGAGYFIPVVASEWSLVKNTAGGLSLRLKFLTQGYTIEVEGFKRALDETFIPQRFDDLIARDVVMSIIDREVFKLARKSSNESDAGVIRNLLSLRERHERVYREELSNWSVMNDAVREK